MAKFKVVKSSDHDYGYNNPGSTALKGGLTSFTTTSNNQFKPRVKIGSASNADGSIIRQKGAQKFMVTDGATIQDEFIVAGNKYMISLKSNTDWEALGAGPNADVGEIFTATKDGTGLATGGQVFAVDTCTLVNKANGSLAAGEMNLLCTKPDTNTFYAKRVTNKYVWDWSDNKYLVGVSATTATDPDTVNVSHA